MAYLGRLLCEALDERGEGVPGVLLYQRENGLYGRFRGPASAFLLLLCRP